MVVEMRNAAAHIEEAAQRAEQGGFHNQATWLRKQAGKFGTRAQEIEELNGPEYFTKPTVNETTLPAEGAATEETPADQARQLREALSPYVQEYKSAKILTPELVNNTWIGIWGAIGERVGFTYQLPECDRTQEELARLRKENRTVLLLPDDIYTPEGLVRLGQAFPLMTWATKPEEAVRISHSSTRGGSVDIEMSHDAPYRTAKGYNEQVLREKIAADGRVDMRLPTYIVGGQFSKLLTGHYFDENTWSRTPGSFSDGQALIAYFSSDGDLYVDDWHPSHQRPDLGGRSEGVKRA